MNFVKIKGFIFTTFIVLSSLFFMYADNSKEQIILEIWTPSADILCPNCEKGYLAEAISIFEKANPHIIIIHKKTDDYFYGRSITQLALSNNKQPDVFLYQLGNHVRPYLNKGMVLSLNNYLSNRTKQRLLKGVYANITIDNKICGIPFTGSVAFIFCNTEIFEENNLPYPATFEELVAVCKKLKAKGIIPFAYSNTENAKWSNLFFYETLVVRHGGYETIFENIVKKNAFKHIAFLKAAEDITVLVDAGAFPEDKALLNYKDGIKLFSSGKAAMCYSGSWVLGMIGENNRLIKEKKIKAIRFPIVKNGKGNNKDTWGGAYEAFMVSAHSKYKKEACSFVEFISEYIAEQHTIHSSIVDQNISLWQTVTSVNKKDTLIQQINDLAIASTNLIMGWDIFLGEENTEIYWDNLQALFSGTITPEEFYKSLPGNY